MIGRAPHGPREVVRAWLSRACCLCGARKPLFTAYCDRCWGVVDEETNRGAR